MTCYFSIRKVATTFFLVFFHIAIFAQPNNLQDVKITEVTKLNATTVELSLSNNKHILIDFYGENIFRFLLDSTVRTFRNPLANPPAQILVDNPRKPVSSLQLEQDDSMVTIKTTFVKLILNKSNSLFKVFNNKTGKIAVEEIDPVDIKRSKSVITLSETANEYFYGGGVQNGRFSHKGKVISIENQNSWTDGGVASPNPFYWSTGGYGVMWHTFKKGKYDFGSKQEGIVSLYHETDYADVFFMVDDNPNALLQDYYQLTGNPILLPKMAFYEGHLNAYNRDYWKEDSLGLLFEDGKKYRENQKNNGGIKESLNGEKNNYPFSARAVIDRYKANDMPLGWILPNDGYGAGYGQTSTLDSNILNLKNFGDYARKSGVQIGLWTQSDLHPKEGIDALLQRDIIKEVKDAGVRVLKTDVAWVGPGYSFGLNGIADVAKTTSKYGNNARPFIITLDGWSGTQRYAAVWTGDQTGGEWEYIRFHIPTYIGSGLSGQPNITSDMDGIFGGGNTPVNTRDFQWKTFTPMELNMDGWGTNPKYPHILGEPATSINRHYLKWKSALLPYSYSVAKTAVDGLPIIRPMFLEDANAFTLGTATRYQFMYGPSFLIAPIYQDTHADSTGNDIRNNIYLPKGTWIDYFSGEQYEGDCILNYFEAPLWKLPVFVKPGAIIPMVNPNNNVTEIDKSLRIYELYPAGNSSFTEYDDDGTTEADKSGQGSFTKIDLKTDTKQNSFITINKTTGSFTGFVKEKETILKVNVSQKPQKIKVEIGNGEVKLTEATSLEELNNKQNVFYYDATPNLNRFATKGSEFEKLLIIKNPQLIIKLKKTDITKNKIDIAINGYVFIIHNKLKQTSGEASAPSNATVVDSNAAAFSLKPSWGKVTNTDFYELLFNDVLYTNIKDTSFLLDELQPDTTYNFQLRAVNKEGVSKWANIEANTKPNPLLFAIKGIAATSSANVQEGYELYRFFDFDDGDDWHTEYGAKAVPFDILMDLKSVNQLDRIQYLPRASGRNGIITKAAIYYSQDKKDWTLADSVTWARTNNAKEFIFKTHPTAQYIKLSVTQGVGDYGSGRELYVFKVPGSASFIHGDINSDGKIDANDLTSYTNYTGLRKGDSDFEGYISNGDINKNGLIDAYDISNVATQLDGGINMETDDSTALSGLVIISSDKKSYKKGDTITITIRGENLNNVNALSFGLPYNQQNYEYTGAELLHTKQMENLTYDRLHTNGIKALYPTLINIGDKETLSGSRDLLKLKFNAKRDIIFDFKPVDGFIVDKNLKTITF